MQRLKDVIAGRLLAPSEEEKAKKKADAAAKRKEKREERLKNPEAATAVRPQRVYIEEPEEEPEDEPTPEPSDDVCILETFCLLFSSLSSDTDLSFFFSLRRIMMTPNRKTKVILLANVKRVLPSARVGQRK